MSTVIGTGTGFRPVLHAEWTKFRTVRGWVVGMVLVALLTVGIALLNHSSCGGTVMPGGQDCWWDVTPDSDPEDIAARLEIVIRTYLLPTLLERRTTPSPPNAE